VELIWLLFKRCHDTHSIPVVLVCRSAGFNRDLPDYNQPDKTHSIKELPFELI